MVASFRAAFRGVWALGVLAFLVTSGGCLSPEKHTAMPAYYEHDGMWCGTYPIGFEEARVGVRNTLAELKMPILLEGPDRRGTFIDSKTPDNFEVRIFILPPGRRADGTRICVRVGGFGTHRKICERLLDDIGRHMEAVRHIYAPAPPPGVLPGAPPLTATPPGTSSAPPSLPPQPVPVGQ